MGHIKNFDTLAVNDLRRDALAIAEAGYEAIHTERVVRDKVQVVSDELHISDKVFKITGRRVYFVGVGKCAISAGRTIENILGDALTAGVALDVADTNPDSSSKIEVYIGTHPLPSEANERGAKRVVEFLSGLSEKDLVIMFISGGGSTLLCLPSASMTYSDESELFKKLTDKGAPIQDLNIVRKHISRARGGALAVSAYPAEIISLIASDVQNDDFEIIASGPTVHDSSTIDDAKAILAKNEIQLSSNVQFIETEKDKKYFKRVTNILILSNTDALSGMKDEAVRRGYTTTIMEEHFTGEARDVGRTVAEKLHSSAPKTALLYAGESTVTLSTEHGAGGPASPETSSRGGRNQEIALSALEYLNPDELILPFASDGRDNTDHAGAITDETTRAHTLEKSLSAEEYLDAHRSYDFFKSSGDALITGYTGSNVSDLMIALKK
jgi:glycerate-2-kinase